MTEKTSWTVILKDLDELCELHDRATSDYEKCRKFNGNLAKLLEKLEDTENYKMADRVMDVLINCSPKEASHCEKSSFVGEKIKGITKRAYEEARN
ncbi:hypothetical protein MSLAZ_0610 [Methanosarcina lacustris Z-7289]|uniref:Uncharacterized protein n=1 Tax=Methanosarcina lacustris Z-7289 TaxID=1434111 RepID=A0A0E3S1F0_9EURY|nr:hypothetical protein [Methanosarcina lacustris]AKB73871.1 hypothetical protein MSLAZ_0610 [Methanosarcina lacustris Z-7289]